MTKITILGLLVLLAVLVMPTALASEYYLLPDNCSVANPSDCTTVSVWMNATQGISSGLFNITFDAGCAEVTSFTYNNTCFIDPVTQAIAPGRLTVGFSNSPSGPTNSPCTPGHVHLGDFEICCNTTTPPCQTDLEFNTGTGMWDNWAAPVSFTVDDGKFTCGTPLDEFDLNVTNIYFNPGDTRANETLRVYVNQSNDIVAIVRNNGPDDVTGDFDVCFEVDGNQIDCVTVTGGLLAGAEKSVPATWTPTCAEYPEVMPGYPLKSSSFTINVTADCNSSNCPNCPDGTCGKITESDETNNRLSMYVPAIQRPAGYTYDVIGGVVNNGYKSKNFDCDTTEEPLDPFKYFDLTGTGGGMEYNVSGGKISTFAPDDTSTRVHTINLPSGAVVKEARLYVYWYDKWGNYETYPSGCLANLSVNFSNADLAPDVVYQDSKAFEKYQSPKGSSVFNVTSLVSGSGDYTAIVKNIEPITGNTTTLLGEMLVVVYDGADHGLDVRIWMLEGTDYLMAADDTYGSYAFHVSPEEATSTVAFSGSINLAMLSNARLITVVAQGMTPGSDMLFNGNVIKTDSWDAPTEVSGKINVEDVSVTSNLLASGNNMGFRDTGTGGMQAQNAFLVLTESAVQIAIDQPEYVDPQSQFTINITVDPCNLPVSAVQYDLYYDTSVVWAEWANPGPFLNGTLPTDVTVLEIDNLWDVPNHIGKISYAETALGTGGVLPYVTEKGIITTIHFSAIGVRGTSTGFIFSDILVADTNKNSVDYIATDCGVTIYDNIPPVAIASSKYMVSNVASKFQCIAALCCCNSHGGDLEGGEWKGNEIVYVRWDFGDGQYGTSEGLVECQKHHEYTTWNWNDITDEYEPFIAYLTVRDDGVPQLSDTVEQEVVVYIAGDANGDGVVDIFDAACVGKHWGQSNDGVPDVPCGHYWDELQKDEADLNNDNAVDTIDAMIVGTNWNHLAYYPYIKE